MRNTRGYPGRMLILAFALTACGGAAAEEAGPAESRVEVEAPDPVVQQLRGAWTLVVGTRSLDVMLREDGTAMFGKAEYRYSVDSAAQPVEVDLTPVEPELPADRWIIEVVTPTKVRVAMAGKADEPRPTAFTADGPMLFKDPTEAMAVMDRRNGQELDLRMPVF